MANDRNEASVEPERGKATADRILDAAEQVERQKSLYLTALARDAFDELDAPVLRVTGADVPMPYNKHLERAAKADPAKVIAAVKRVLYLA